MPAVLTNWMTIALSGATVDGRTLDAADLKHMANAYNPETYCAVVNFEHLYGNLGTVRELRTMEKDGKTALQARICPNKYYYMANGECRGVFFSIEFIRQFADTGKPYLVGLAATDRPASLGTSELHFAIDDAKPGVERCEPVKLTTDAPETANFIDQLGALIAPLLSHFTTKKEDDTMTTEELTQAVSAALAPVQEQLSNLKTQVENLTANSSGGTPGKGEDSTTSTEPTTPPTAGEEFSMLKESFNTMSEQLNALSKRVDEALSSVPPKKGAGADAPAGTQTPIM